MTSITSDYAMHLEVGEGPYRPKNSPGFDNYRRFGSISQKIEEILPSPHTWDSATMSWMDAYMDTLIHPADDDQDQRETHRSSEAYLYNTATDNPFYLFKGRLNNAYERVDAPDSSDVNQFTVDARRFLTGAINYRRGSHLMMQAVQDWKQFRRDSITLASPAVDYEEVLEGVLSKHNDQVLVVVPDEDHPSARKARGANPRFWTTGESVIINLSDYMASVNNTPKVIRQNIIDLMDTESAMRFLEASPEHVFGLNPTSAWEDDCIREHENNGRVILDYHFHKCSKWWIEAHWLAYAEAQWLPHNYCTIIFTDASRMIAQEKLKPTAVYHYLAKLARNKTNVVFLG